MGAMIPTRIIAHPSFERYKPQPAPPHNTLTHTHPTRERRGPVQTRLFPSSTAKPFRHRGGMARRRGASAGSRHPPRCLPHTAPPFSLRLPRLGSLNHQDAPPPPALSRHNCHTVKPCKSLPDCEGGNPGCSPAGVGGGPRLYPRAMTREPLGWHGRARKARCARPQTAPTRPLAPPGRAAPELSRHTCAVPLHLRALPSLIASQNCVKYRKQQRACNAKKRVGKCAPTSKLRSQSVLTPQESGNQVRTQWETKS